MTPMINLRLFLSCFFIVSIVMLDADLSHANTNQVEIEIVGNGPNCDSGRTFNWSDLPNSAEPYATMKDLVAGDFYKVTNKCGGGQDLSLRRGVSPLTGLQWYSSPDLIGLLAQDHLLPDGSSAYLYIPSDFSISGETPGDFKSLIRKPAGGVFPVFLPYSPFTVGNLVVVDADSPTVVGVTTLANNQSFKSTMEILIQVHFSEIVNVLTTHGAPTLNLAVRESGHPAIYLSGDGTSILTFSYVVSSGDNSHHLDFVSTSALTLNQSQIYDDANNQAILDLPSPGSLNSLSGGHHVVIDTEPPGVEISRQGGQSLVANQNDLVFFHLSEASEDFSIDCLQITGGTVSNFSGSGDSYLAVVTPGNDLVGDLVIAVRDGVFTDSAGNENPNLVSLSIPFDTTTPVVEEVADVVVNQVATTQQAIVSNAVSVGDAEQVPVNVPAILERKTLPRVGAGVEQILLTSLVLLFSGLALIAISRKRSLLQQKL